MAGAVQTPEVSFMLDDSEAMRLEKLRAELKLAHWDRIGEKFDLVADDTVAKFIKTVETTDPVKYDAQYAPWLNRYSDFTMKWEKTRNKETNEVEGQLVAVGRPRIKHLGKIGEGCKVVLMKGPMLADPLPTTEVGDLRINHLSMKITFLEPLQLDDNEREEKNFKVGYRNKLFGDELREKNKNKFKIKQAEKKGTFTQDMLQTLIDSMAAATVKKKTTAKVEEDDNISDLEENKTDGLENAGRDRQRYRPTPEMNKLKDHVRVNVGPTHGDPNHQADGGQPVDGAAALDNSNDAPPGNMAAAGQVSIDIQHCSFSMCLQTQLLRLLNGLEKHHPFQLSFQTPLSQKHHLVREILA